MSMSSTGPDDGFNAALFPVDEGLMDEMVAFGGLHYPMGDPYRNRAYREWLFLANPHGRAHAAVIRHEGAIVGQAALIPIRFRLPGGSSHLGHFVVDVLTHPSHRNRRLFSRIIDAAMEEARRRGTWLLGHPNAAALRGWQRKEMQFQPPLSPSLLVPSPARQGRWVRDKGRILQAWSGFQGPPALSEMPEIDRTVEYIEWRFFRRPDKAYSAGLLLDGDSMPRAWQASTPWRHGLRLLVDHACKERTHLVAGLGTLALLPPREPQIANSVRLPVRKEIPFFLTNPAGTHVDCRRITLAASDF